MDWNSMTRIITTYIFVLMLVSLGFFGVGTIATAQEARPHAAAAHAAGISPGQVGSKSEIRQISGGR
jgi:hypothetical protein